MTPVELLAMAGGGLAAVAGGVAVVSRALVEKHADSTAEAIRSAAASQAAPVADRPKELVR
jgi:hypothetical protein